MSSLAESPRPDPEDAPGTAPLPGPEERLAPDARRLIENAEALGIPWREILSREIQAESTLQRFLGSEIDDLPLWRALSILPATLLHSWRARELVDRLCWKAAAEGSGEARREVTALLDCLTGKRARGVRSEATLAQHYWFAYNRVLELQALALAAEECNAAPGLRVAAVSQCSGAPRRDVEWAVARLASGAPPRSGVLEDAMARVREEGFEIPRAPTESAAFSRLRRFVSCHRLFRPRRPPRRDGAA